MGSMMHRTRRAVLPAVALVAAFALAQPPADPVRIERTSPADVPAGATTLVSRDVSQWTCLQRMPSSVVVPVNVRMSDQAEATREPAVEDVSAWFEPAATSGAPGIDVTLDRVEQVWDVTAVGAPSARGFAYRVFCRVVVAVTPGGDARPSDASEDVVAAEVTLRNVGGHAFTLVYPLRVVPQR
jgi:hypothetical protein